jgi:hypothetical protein
VKGNRLVPFLLALVLIAFALGSLPRSQPGGSLLLNSYWLIYLVYLAPLVTLGLIIFFIAYLAYSWLTLSDAIGFLLARKKKLWKKKQSRTIQMLTYVVIWAIAVYVLFQKCGGLFCKSSSQPFNISTPLKDAVTGSGPGPTLPLLSSLAQLSSIVQSNWFDWAFLGLLTISTVIVARGVMVYAREARTDALNQFAISRAEGIAAVTDAISVLKGHADMDPRSRIINCYQRMLQAAQRLGAKVTSAQTARELETAIRKTLFIDGSAIGELTNLFEEARYSLHSITENDADQAQRWLEGIAEQMNTSLTPL